MNVVFMGTPEFAVPSLKCLIESKYYVVAVITQTDKPRGRKGQPIAPPVKSVALDAGLPVIQPENVNSEQVIEQLEKLNPDVIVVVAFGQKISDTILSLPKYKCINIHASLLPKYRGAAPINWAIVNGEKETGITTIIMSNKMDAGDIIANKSLVIGPEETAGELGNRLSMLGAETLLDSLMQIETGNAEYTRQDERHVSLAPKIKKDDCLINWNQQEKRIHDFVRGMNPKPSAYTFLMRNNSKERIIILRTERDGPSQNGATIAPGTIIDISSQGIKTATKDGSIWIKEVKPEGKRMMSAAAFSRGHDLKVDYLFQ
ncbi:methionyl-tRNA formyltransferase [Candidatus Scalindua japonica]|uniref:Methionyl-tRNA formyltransferase n=1 Tax=Candidatus Scalindua japonica TaxID=1284222 RepID=A0A286U3L3_9BACT|nr:methionyl-tRNA formyltransferase [Candidatus Scalindua japonica]GAX62723.1 methionyl-tRNA formyltransferase [Candidatus Scalindua japonica]